MSISAAFGNNPEGMTFKHAIVGIVTMFGKFQRCPFNVGKPFFRWGYVILSQNKSDLVVF